MSQYKIRVWCDGSLPLKYRWSVSQESWDQRDGYYDQVVATGSEDTEEQADAAADAWCSTKYSKVNKSMSKTYEWKPV